MNFSCLGFIKVHGTRYLVDTLGFKKHAQQIRERRGETLPAVWYTRPFFYTLYLPNEKLKESGNVIVIPPFVEKPDYEFEIVGLCTEDIETTDETRAVKYVKEKMLFTIMNDMSARDAQAEDMQMPLSVSASKGILPKVFGPQWVHGSCLKMDENGVPDIDMRLFVNGIERCHDNFRSIYFIDPKTNQKRCWGFAQVIAWFGTKNQGFKKGHLLGSGTIGNGCVAENASYPWLKHGDRIRMEASNIGIIENTIHRETA